MFHRNRPTAWDVTFGDEPHYLPGPSNLRSNALPPPPQTQPPKRKLNSKEQDRAPKRPKLPPVCIFHLPNDFVVESSDLIIAGEDDQDDDQTKPVRNLWDFTIFDPSHQNQLLTLQSLERPDGADCVFKAFGNVTVFVENEEDEGQEDDLFSAPDVVQPVLLGPITNIALDYTKKFAPLFIETKYAWYILQIPSSQYKPFLHHFYLPHRIAQMLITSSLEKSSLTREKFEKYLERAPPLLDRQFTKDDLLTAASVIHDALKEAFKTHPQLKNVPIIKNHYLQSLRTTTSSQSSERRRGLTAKNPPTRRSGDPDLAVLRPENQTRTTVTPRIGALAQPYFRENLYVVAPPPKTISAQERRKEKTEMAEATDRVRKRLLNIIRNCHENGKCRWNYEKTDQFWRGSKYVKAIMIDGVKYKIGDTILVPIGDDPAEPSKGKGRGKGKEKEKEKKLSSFPSATADIPHNKSFPDFFWFGRIITIDIDQQTLHIQWYNHGGSSVMGEFAHPQELFLQALCGPVLFDSVAAQVTVHYHKPQRTINQKVTLSNMTDNIPLGEYFCKSEYEPNTAEFTVIRDEFYSPRSTITKKPENCPVCDLVAEHKQKEIPEALKDHAGVSLRGSEYHISDFVLYRSESMSGPGSIGQIIKFEFPQRETSWDPILVVVKKLGRASALRSILPENEFVDERELFCTEDRKSNQEWIHATALIQVCYVTVTKERSPRIENWVLHSPSHFYVRFLFPSLNNNTWEARKSMKHRNLQICAICYEKCTKEAVDLNEFVTVQQARPLRALDVFGGGGAFGAGLSDGSLVFNVTHAIEIAPSAAQTYRKNSPHTKVYNICINDAVKRIARREFGTESSNELPEDRRTSEPVEVSLKPGDIEVIIAGFPCQPHSTQNMFKRANDSKTSLILPLLSAIDILRPLLLILENVHGFINCRLMAKQVTQHIIEGGYKQGALKLLIRALIDMGYQLRFSLLQAGHYGTPQGRVRFFLVASLPGTPLPELPQPTHDFPLEGVAPHLRINLENGRTLEPVRTARGRALFPLVTVGDAISDLRLFDWAHPFPHKLTEKQRIEARQRKAKIPHAPTRVHLPHWGLPEGDQPYESFPRSRFQLLARARGIPQSIQHYTRCFPARTVERVLNIPLAPGSDHWSLPRTLGEFQTVNPEAYAMKSRGKKSLYKRLNPDSHFMTTITNISPTAKQSSVINPWCYRILTVRELARSQGLPDHFFFCALGDNVITMHRCIGNAVPWQLSLALGEEIKKALLKKWKNRDEIVIDDDDDKI